MGDKGLDEQENEFETKSLDSYKVVSYYGNKIPSNYKSIVFAKFLRSLRQGNEYYKLTDAKAYFTVYHAYLETILERPDTLVKFAVLSDDSDVVLGFSIVGLMKLHYVYVHKYYRKKGIGRDLTQDPFEVITHLTRHGASIWNNRFPKVRFNPWG